MAVDLSAIFSSYEGRSHELIPLLQDVQAEFGYLSEEAMLEIAEFTGVPDSRVYAVATFYTQFRLGYAAAMSYVLLALTLIISLVNRRFLSADGPGQEACRQDPQGEDEQGSECC